MELKNQEEQLVMRYLLGELSDEERSQVEERFFADDQYYESLLVAEDELIYNYLRGALSPQQRDRFETQLAASPGRRDKMQFVKDLMAAASASSAASATEAYTPPIIAPLVEPATARPRPSVWESLLAFLTGRNAALQFAMAAAIVIVALGGWWMWHQSRSLSLALEAAKARQNQYEQSALEAQARADAEQQKADNLQKRNAALSDDLKREQEARAELAKANGRLISRLENPAMPTGLTIPFTLEPGLSRSNSEEPRTLSLPRRAGQLKLTLALGSDDGNGRYRAELSTRGGTLIWGQDGLMSRHMEWGRAVIVTFPAGVLRNSEYDLTIKRVIGKGAFEDVGYYYFKIIKP